MTNRLTHKKLIRIHELSDAREQIAEHCPDGVLIITKDLIPFRFKDLYYKSRGFYLQKGRELPNPVGSGIISACDEYDNYLKIIDNKLTASSIDILTLFPNLTPGLTMEKISEALKGAPSLYAQIYWPSGLR